MKFKLESRSSIAEIIVEEGNTKIVEDVAVYTREKEWHIHEDQIEEVLKLAYDMFKFSNFSDVDIAEHIVTNLLSSSEREELIERFRSEDEED